MKTFVFLDIDGVLNTYVPDDGSDRVYIEPRHPAGYVLRRNTNVLQKILDKQENVHLILSSSWRTIFSLEAVNDMLRRAGVTYRCIDRTPEIQRRKMSEDITRTEEISRWIKKNPLELEDKILIIDDERIEHFLSKFWLRVDGSKGLTNEQLV